MLLFMIAVAIAVVCGWSVTRKSNDYPITKRKFEESRYLTEYTIRGQLIEYKLH